MEVLTHLCPRVQYISLRYFRRSLDATVYYRRSKIKDATHHLFSLCIFGASVKWIGEWEDLIKSREVFGDYSTKYMNRKYYLWWEH